MNYLSLKNRIKKVITAPWRFFQWFCFSVGLLAILISLGLGTYAFLFYRSLPNIAEINYITLKKIAQKRVHSNLENKKSYYEWIELGKTHRDYLYAITMSEDSTFFEHEGLDFEAMLDSLAQNLKNKSYEYGASTITQQVAKNLFLTQNKTINRKIKELFITRSLEKHLTKNQILELYVNIAEFGPDIYGITAAAKEYFGKKPSQINAAEGAFIALMLPSPRRLHYSLFQNKNLTPDKKRKIRRILGDMLANDFISYEQYKTYSKYDYHRRLRQPASR